MALARPVEEFCGTMPKLTGSLETYPARVSLFWYTGLILLGAIILAQPICGGNPDQPISALDAIFTATSATCVTGLAVRSTEHDFSFLGQLTILVLIQVGGIGIMTVTTFVMFRLGGRESLRHRALVTETLGADEGTDLQWILRRVIVLTLVFEGCGCIILALRNLFEMPPGQALWHALFHSVSAFCNAGFALHDSSLSRYRGDPLVNVVICILIVVGGIGFPVIVDLQRHRGRSWRDRWDHLHLHTKFMLIGTASLLLLGFISVLIIEWDGVLKDIPLWQRPMVAMFHSVSSRTAGFNTVEISQLTNATLFITILLMMIGAGPCSTGGGFKVSTVMVLVVHAWWTLRGYTRVNLFRRSLPSGSVARATATAMLFGVLAGVALTSLLVIEQSGHPHTSAPNTFLDALFEVVSALGTVGLSTGVTSNLTAVGQLIIILLMLMGRLGPISVFVALAHSRRKEFVEYPGEEPMIG